MKKTVVILAAIVIAALFLASCFSSWQGEEGTFSIHFGGGSQRAIEWPLNEEIISQLTHTIKLSGGPGAEQTTDITGVKTVQFTVIPGHWNVDVEAFLEGELIARGSWSGGIKAGNNGSISIPMQKICDSPDDDTDDEPGDETDVENVFIITIENIIDSNLKLGPSGVVIYLFDEPQTAVFIIEGAGSYDVKWYLGDEFMGDGMNLTLNAPALGTVGKKILTAIVIIGGVPYSVEIEFMVEVQK